LREFVNAQQNNSMAAARNVFSFRFDDHNQLITGIRRDFS